MNKYFTKEDVWMANKHMKIFLLFTIHYCSFKKCKLKPQVNAITPVRMTNVKKMDTPSVGGDVEEQEPLYTAVGNIKWYNHFEKQLGVFLKI